MFIWPPWGGHQTLHLCVTDTQLSRRMGQHRVRGTEGGWGAEEDPPVSQLHHKVSLQDPHTLCSPTRALQP